MAGNPFMTEEKALRELEELDEIVPTDDQARLVQTIRVVVSLGLARGRGSGRTTARLLVAKAILEDDPDD